MTEWEKARPAGARSDAHCDTCPFSDRGDWMVYRNEWEALLAERDRARVALAASVRERDEAIVNAAQARAEVERLHRLAFPDRYSEKTPKRGDDQ